MINIKRKKESACDHKMMHRALQLAQKGQTSPNPKVGCVIAAGTKILGEGYHTKAGMPHAEIEALYDAKRKKNDIRNATLYVTLEPCSHTSKRTPPCVAPIIQSGITKIVIAMRDPNPQVNGKGILALKHAGISVEEGLLQENAKELNKAYTHWITTQKPYVILKEGVTLDGKIATQRGKKEQISCTESNEYVQKLRSSVDAIMVGIGTVEKDDPHLTTRIPNGKNPLRIIIDSTLKIKESAHVLNDTNVRIITTDACDKKKYAKLTKNGFQVLIVKKTSKGQINLHALTEELGKVGIQSVLIEGGSKIAASALREQIVNKVLFFIAPKLIGNDAVSAIGYLRQTSMNDAILFKNSSWQPIGSDMLFHGEDLIYEKKKEV